MKASMGTNRLTYAVNRFLDDAGKTRFIVTNRDTEIPTIGLSIYEFDLMVSGSSPNSTDKYLNQLAYLYTWASLCGIDMDSLLLRGGGMTNVHIRKFTYWLRERNTRKNTPLTSPSYNSIVNRCATFCSWCRIWRENPDHPLEDFTKNLQQKQMEKQSWSNRTLRVRSTKMAPNLEEDEILAVQKYLKPQQVIKHASQAVEVAFRDYLIWRLAIEMGLRISEILALRLKDCPQQGRNYISVVRIEERGSGYIDPRGTYAPRPKTLSRDLGFIINGTPLPRLIQDYISKYRYKKTLGGTKQFMLNHDFLIIAHDTAAPLSITSAESVGKKISINSGVTKFHWHIVRHAFFNRAYAAVVEEKSQLSDLIYYGGWSDSNSLNIYIQRAVRDRSIKSLALWQQCNQWEALN